MKVDNVDSVDELVVSRGVFVASFAAFIFTSLFSIAIASSGLLGGSSMATAYYSGKQAKANLAQVVTSTKATTSNTTVAPKPTVTLSINPTTVPQGVATSVKLNWKSTNATKCLVKKNGVMFIDNLLNGEAPVLESSAATFSVDCTGAGGTVTAQAGLTTTAAPAPTPTTNPNTGNVAIVQGPTSVTIGTNPTKVPLGGSTAVVFTMTTNLTGCLITKDNAEAKAMPFLKPEFSRNDGVQSGALNSDTTFTIACTGKVDKKEYKAQALVTVDKTAATQKVVTTLSATPTTVAANGTATINWISKYADTCVLTKSNYDSAGKIVNKTPISTQLNGTNFVSEKLTQTTKFMLECRNSLGADVSFVDVNVGATAPTTGDKPLAQVTISPTAVNSGGTTMVSFASKYADSCVLSKANLDASGNIGAKTQLSNLPYASNIPSGVLTQSTRFIAECKNKYGDGSAFVDVKIATVTPPTTGEKPAVTINTNPTSVNAGGEVLVSYASKNANSCVVTKANVDNAGNLTNKTEFYKLPYASNLKSGALTSNTRFLLECKNAAGTASAFADVKVNTTIPPTTPTTTTALSVKITASPMVVTAGQTTNISWTSTGASFCNIYENEGNTLWKTGLNGKDVVSTPLTKTRQYTASCSMNGKTIAASVIVEVKAAVPTVKPTAKISVANSEVKAGVSTNITWSSTGSDKCVVSKGITSISTQTNGTLSTGVLSESSVYWITCTNSIGSYSDAVTVQVR